MQKRQYNPLKSLMLSTLYATWQIANSKLMLCSISDVLQQMDKCIDTGRFVSSVDSLKLLRRDYSRIWLGMLGMQLLGMQP